MARLGTIITNIFLLLIFLQLAPTLIKSIKTSYEGVLEPKTKVGLISIKDTLYDSTEHAKNLKRFFEHKDIKAIVIKMDCPGGAAGAAQALFNEIKELKKQHLKPIITWVQNVSASGGYYVACATDHIIATPSALMGSVGAYIPHPYFKNFIEMFKIQYSTINAGAYKTAGNPLLELTPEQEKMFKGLVVDIYQKFTQDVVAQRPKLSLSTVNTWADGKIFTGQQALALGLIDELGSQVTAEQYIKNKLAISTAVEWVHPTCKSSLMKLITSNDCDESGDEHSYITSAVQAVCSYVENSWLIAR